MMLPEAKEAIRLADKHLAGASPERRKALALDIQAAICKHAATVAADALRRLHVDITTRGRS